MKLTQLSEARKKKGNSEQDAIDILKQLPQPIGIKGGSYTYWVDVTKKPLVFTASDGSVLDNANELEDIARWLDRDKADEWLDFLFRPYAFTPQELVDDGMIRKDKNKGQAAHEKDQHGW